MNRVTTFQQKKNRQYSIVQVKIFLSSSCLKSFQISHSICPPLAEQSSTNFLKQTHSCSKSYISIFRTQNRPKNRPQIKNCPFTEAWMIKRATNIHVSLDNCGPLIYYKGLYLTYISWTLQNIIRFQRAKKNMAETLDLMRGFVCGTISGWAQVFVMQPFEIIKVRLVNQSLFNPEYKGIVDCFNRILKEEGVKSFYKGTLSPLLGYGIQGSLAFGSNELFKEMITYFDPQKHSIMPMSHIFLSGILTGMISTLAITPADHTRIIMQKDTGKTQPYKGSIDAGRDIYRRFGLRGLYLGFHATFLRQVLANAVYFYSYEYIMRLFAPKGEGSLSAPIFAAFLAGGLAGCNSWLFTYPVDYVKTIMQSQNLEKIKYKSAWECAREQYKLQGHRTFFKGLGITMLRSFPVNGVAFFSYEYVMRRMGWKKQ